MSELYQPKTITPTVEKRSFDGVEKECFIVEVNGDEYEMCEKTAPKMWSNKKPGTYGAGLGRTEDDPHKPMRTGLLGQMAFGKVFDLPVDLVYREKGDKQDNLIGGKYKVDVKCAMRDYGTQLIYHTNEWGKRIPLDKDIYIQSFIESEDRVAKTAKIVIVGFVTKDIVKTCEVKPGRKGNGHKNYEVPFSIARPITLLLESYQKHFVTA